jgi:hypothetical protein
VAPLTAFHEKFAKLPESVLPGAGLVMAGAPMFTGSAPDGALTTEVFVVERA